MNDKNKNKKPFYGKDNNSTKKSAAPKFVTLTFKLGESEKYDSSNFESLTEKIESCSFGVCVIPAKMKKTTFFGSDDAKGTVDIGEIRSYDPETREFSVSVSANTNEKIKSFVDDLVMIVNVRTDKETNDVKFIASFELVEGNAFVPVK